ncbi:hypothetical protein BC937DRAFT_94988 [Endogone sp. FLAS-F59071]|nr:hypothetical protein BC937DRAFT_94988 [Endogone sp. FLAS-F59071]|eukprot:RUS20539.1 hypothetical protein BC937DRAFT_94988 [Endogone sp. FLAS-F59071]
MSDAQITLKTMDGIAYTVPAAYLARSKLVQDWIRDGEEGVLDFCEIHAADTTPPLADPAIVTTPYELDPRDDRFRAITDDTLLQFTMAADILQIPELIRLTTQEMAKRIDGKSPDQIREMFNPDELNEEDVDLDEEEGMEVE